MKKHFHLIYLSVLKWLRKRNCKWIAHPQPTRFTPFFKHCSKIVLLIGTMLLTNAQLLQSQCSEGKVTLELGVIVDYYAYITNYNEDTSAILQDIDAMFTEIEYFYESQLIPHIQFDLDLVIVGGGPIIFDTPDDFDGGVTAVRPKLNGFWNMHMPCVPKDAIILLRGWDYPLRAGAATGAVCADAPNDVDVAFIDKFGKFSSPNSFALAHEIGHLLGAPELESTECDSLCFGTGLNLLMCSEGGATGGLPTAQMADCTIFDEFNPFMEEHCDGCLSALQGMTGGCQICMETAMITADNMDPVPSCDGLDTIHYNITVCNSCDPQELKVEVTFDIDKVDIILTPPFMHNFDTIINPDPQFGTPIRHLTSILNFAGEECIDFHYSVIIEPDELNDIVSNVKVQEQTIATVRSSTISETIGQPGTVTSLKSLTQPGVVIMNPGALACDTSWTAKKKFKVAGTLEIDTNYCLNNYRFMMEPGARIVVKAGSGLEIKNGTKIFGCDQMWQGVHLEEGARLTVDDATIEDAQYAVKASGNSDISVTFSTFNRNFIGVYIDNPYTGYTGNTNFPAFYGNIFDGAGGLLTPYAGQGHDPAGSMGGEAFAGVWIGNPSAAVHSLGNTFKTLSNGIFAKNTSLKVTDCSFENILENSYPAFLAGYGIRAQDRSGTRLFQQTGFGGNIGDPASFANCSKAIKVIGMPVDYIQENFMRVDKGIELVNTHQEATLFRNSIQLYETNSIGIEVSHPDPSALLRVFYNTVDVPSFATGGIGIQYNAMGLDLQGDGAVVIRNNDVFLGTSGAKGLVLIGANSVTVQQNDVTLNQGANGSFAYRVNSDYNSLLNCNNAVALGGADGIGIDIWDAESTRYHCNDFLDMTTGVYFQMGSMSQENFKENVISGGDVGLKVGATSNIGTQTHKGNLWTGTFGNFGAEHESDDPAVWFQSRFTVHDTTGGFLPSLPMPPSHPDQSPWFPVLPGTPDSDCAGPSTCVVIGGPPDDDVKLLSLDSNIVNGNFQVSEHATEVGWLAKRYTYRKLAKDGSLIVPGSAYETFHNNESGTSVGQFVEVNLDLSEVYHIDSAVQSQMDNEWESIASSLESIDSFDSRLALGYDPVLAQLRAAELLNISTSEASLEALTGPIDTQQIIDVDNIIPVNTAVFTSLVFESNKKTVNDIYLNTLAKGVTEYDSTQVVVLRNIALQCPLSGGSAVFEARSMLSVVEDSGYDDSILCARTQGMQRNEKELEQSKHGFSLFPNPAREQVTLVLPEGFKGGKVVFLNSLGTMLREEYVVPDAGTAQVSTDQLISGMYQVTVVESGKTVFSGKLVIVR